MSHRGVETRRQNMTPQQTKVLLESFSQEMKPAVSVAVFSSLCATQFTVNAFVCVAYRPPINALCCLVSLCASQRWHCAPHGLLSPAFGCRFSHSWSHAARLCDQLHALVCAVPPRARTPLCGTFLPRFFRKRSTHAPRPQHQHYQMLGARLGLTNKQGKRGCFSWRCVAPARYIKNDVRGGASARLCACASPLVAPCDGASLARGACLWRRRTPVCIFARDSISCAAVLSRRHFAHPHSCRTSSSHLVPEQARS